MTRLGALLCKLNSPAFNETDEFGRVSCERCAKRKPERPAPIRESDRVMTRVKTRRGKPIPPPHKQKPFVKSGASQ